MSIRAGVVVAVTFEQVNAAPYAKTAAKRDDQSLKNLDCTVEKIHKIILPGAKRGFPQTTLLCPQRSFQKYYKLIFESGRCVFGVFEIYIKTG